jgi:hypothetical protein
MDITVIYDDNSFQLFKSLSETINEKYTDVNLIGYKEDKFKERKKAFAIKGSWAAKQTPFVIIQKSEDKKPLKAFYSEVKDCTLDNIINYLKLLKYD